MLYSYPADYDPATIASVPYTEMSQLNISLTYFQYDIEPQQSSLTKSMG